MIINDLFENNQPDLERILKQWIKNDVISTTAIPSITDTGKIRISLSRDEGPRITHDPVTGGMMKFELRKASNRLIEKLRITGYGDYALGELSPFHFTLTHIS